VCYNERMRKNGMLVMGMMSGTSADGIDVALARVEEETTGEGLAGRAKARRLHGETQEGGETQEDSHPTRSGQILERRYQEGIVRTWGAAMLRPYEKESERRTALKCELVAHTTMPMKAAVRREILRVAEGGACTAGEISQLNFRVGEEFAAAAIGACEKFGVRTEDVDLIGSHGQTIFHSGTEVKFLDGKTASTLQIGEPAVIAERTGIVTVGDFRAADVAAGGQGAPLVPYVDWLLLRDEKVGRVALNLGGIGNVTVLPAGKGSQSSVYSSQFRRGENQGRSPQGLKPVGGQLLMSELKLRPPKENPRAQPGMAVPLGMDQVMAFDTGPGNMVVDGLVAHFTRGRERFDRDARMAMRGRCVSSLLAELLKDPYLRVRPPKSTGREYYGREFVERLLKKAKKERMRPEDLVRTATVFTALSVVDALNRFVMPRVEIGQVIVSGGGARNPLIMAQLAAALAPVEVMTSSEVGVPEEAKEAYAFALLAYATWNGRTGNLPSATGARRAVVLGKICLSAGNCGRELGDIGYQISDIRKRRR
jgi:anhydro-N-acetylmuramic acid kinase